MKESTFERVSSMTPQRLLEVQRLRQAVSYQVDSERLAQNLKWGLQKHPPGVWLGILMEEVGEAAQAVNGLQLPAQAKPTDADNLYDELIQIAAVAQAWAEQLREERQNNAT